MKQGCGGGTLAAALELEKREQAPKSPKNLQIPWNSMAANPFTVVEGRGGPEEEDGDRKRHRVREDADHAH